MSKFLPTQKWLEIKYFPVDFSIRLVYHQLVLDYHDAGIILEIGFRSDIFSTKSFPNLLSLFHNS